MAQVRNPGCTQVYLSHTQYQFLSVSIVLRPLQHTVLTTSICTVIRYVKFPILSFFNRQEPLYVFSLETICYVNISNIGKTQNHWVPLYDCLITHMKQSVTKSLWLITNCLSVIYAKISLTSLDNHTVSNSNVKLVQEDILKTCTVTYVGYNQI